MSVRAGATRLSAVGAALALASVASAQPAASPGPPAAGKASACRMEMTAELKVVFDDANQPIVDARIDGKPVRVVFDTGAYTTLLTRKAARRLGLVRVEQQELGARGVGGDDTVSLSRLADFELAGVHFKNFPIFVSGGDLGVDMLMGRDFFGRTDLELDLAHGMIRLLQPKNCGSDQMVYWAPSYSQAPLHQSQQGGPFVIDVQLNGRTLRAELDSGASVSVASLKAAARAGVALQATGAFHSGIGGSALPDNIGALDSFAAGDEKIGHTKLRFADLFRGTEAAYTGSRIAERPDMPEMLLGADFLRAHRVLISPSQRMMFFTYAGGPVFDVVRKPKAAPAPATAPAAKGGG